MKTQSAVLVAVLAACGGGGGGDPGATSEAVFHAQKDALPGFHQEFHPAAGGVRLDLVFTADGSLAEDAVAVAGGDPQAIVVAGKPGSGRNTLDAAIHLGGQVHVDVSGIKYDGDLPHVPSLDLAFQGDSTFDPFLLDGESKLTANVPPTDLPPIPLSAVVSLVLHIDEGSTITSAFHGTCAAVSSDAKASYVGQSVTAGTLKLTPKVVVKTPLKDVSVQLPAVSVPVPATTSTMDLGTVAVTPSGPAPTGSLATSGTCEAGT